MSGGGSGVAIRTYVEQVQRHRGDFIEACIWASLMRACTPRAYVETDEETDRQTDKQTPETPRESGRPCAL